MILRRISSLQRQISLVRRTCKKIMARKILLLFLILVLDIASYGQEPQAAKIALGSKTAKDGFRNETEIAGKFNNWRTDEDAKIWLATMNYKIAEIENVAATKPHGEKADVQVKITIKKRDFTEGISIKLVSSSNGFNQIDKRWLATYAKIWKMPADVVAALKFFLGETKPGKPSRNADRMFLNELSSEARAAVVDFFTANKSNILSDLFKGDGRQSAAWMMVALKSQEKPRWVLRNIEDTIRFFGTGNVSITRSGNLKIGRITMQRKGGDGGRETAKMLQFKINPVLLFDAK